MSFWPPRYDTLTFSGQRLCLVQAEGEVVGAAVSTQAAVTELVTVADGTQNADPAVIRPVPTTPRCRQGTHQPQWVLLIDTFAEHLHKHKRKLIRTLQSHLG